MSSPFSNILFSLYSSESRDFNSMGLKQCLIWKKVTIISTLGGSYNLYIIKKKNSNSISCGFIQGELLIIRFTCNTLELYTRKMKSTRNPILNYRVIIYGLFSNSIPQRRFRLKRFFLSFFLIKRESLSLFGQEKIAGIIWEQFDEQDADVKRQACLKQK